MPRLPSVDTYGDRPAPRPSGNVTQLSVPARAAEVVSGAEGAALEKAGVGISAAGASIAAEQERLDKELKARIERETLAMDKARADEAYNKLLDTKLDLIDGEKNGFRKLQGSAAISPEVLEDYQKRFKASSEEIAGTLQNDRQRAAFTAESGKAQREFMRDVLHHRAREADQYAQSVFKGTIEIETRNAMSSWSDPGAVGASLLRIENAVSAEAERNQWSPEQRAAVRLSAQSGLHLAVIEQALGSGNTAFAEQYFKANKDAIDPKAQRTIAHHVEDGQQKQLASTYQSAFLGVRDDRRALAALEKRIAEDPKLGEERKNALIGRIQSRGEVLENKAERAQVRWERGIERQVNAVNSVTLAGYEPTTEQLTPLINATKGTSMEGQVKGMVAVANATRQFRNATPQQQEAYLTQIEAEARKDPSKFDVGVVSRLRAIHDNQRQQVKEDPVSFAGRQGFAEVTPLDLSKPAALGPQIAARIDLVRSMRRDYQAPLLPLTKEEATQLSGALKDAKPEQKKEYFAALATATTGDRQAYSAIMSQIAPDDPVTAIAGVYSAGTSQPRRQAGDLMIRGQALLRPDTKTDGRPAGGKLVTMPPDKDLQLEFSSQTDKVFAGRPQAGSDYFQAAKAIYASKTAEDGDVSGAVSSKRWKESIALATGPVETYRGKPILLPESYDVSRFRDALKSQAQALVASGRLADGITQDRLLDLPLDNVGDGRYVFRAGDGVLVDKQNRPVIVDFNRRDAR